jgi:hypothetical protein
MNEVLLALLLSATSPSPPPCCQPATAVFTRADDAKEVRDNIGHLVSPAIITTSVYGTALHFGASKKEARWISVTASLGLVVAKELYDRSVAGRFGLEETGLGVIGTGVGLWVAERIEWPEEKRLR